MSNSGEPDTNASQAVVLFYPTLLIPFEHNVWKRFYGFHKYENNESAQVLYYNKANIMAR